MNSLLSRIGFAASQSLDDESVFAGKTGKIFTERIPFLRTFSFIYVTLPHCGCPDSVVPERANGKGAHGACVKLLERALEVWGCVLKQKFSQSGVHPPPFSISFSPSIFAKGFMESNLFDRQTNVFWRKSGADFVEKVILMICFFFFSFWVSFPPSHFAFI